MKSFSLINVHIDPYDRSPALDRLAQRLSKIVTASYTSRAASVLEVLASVDCVGMTPDRIPTFGPLCV